MKYTEFLFHFIQNLIKVEQKLKEILYNRTKSNIYNALLKGYPPI